jgi:glycosyltransferase involved in cell wall biosynthesis
MNAFSVSVIIPAYNEEATIESAVRQAYAILTNSTADFEIIVVNDGSSDSTAAILNEYFGKVPTIHIHHKNKNEGFGSAIRTGINISTKTYLFCVPADSPLTNELYMAFSNNTAKADVLVSYRQQRIGYTRLMLFNSWLYHKIISLLFGMHLRDYNWIHLYHRKIFDEGKITIEHNGIFMLAEILIKAKRKGFTFYEFEVQQTQRLTGIATASKFLPMLSIAAAVCLFFFSQLNRTKHG